MQGFQASFTFKINEIMKRVFKMEMDYETGERPLIVMPENVLEKDYNLEYYYRRRDDFDPDGYDPEDPDTFEFVMYNSDYTTSEDGSDNVYMKIDGKYIKKEEWDDDESFGEFEEWHDGSNWKKTYYTGDYALEIEEVTEEMSPILENLTLVCSDMRDQGETHYYVHQPTGRYFTKEVSYWQGSGRSAYIERDEEDILPDLLTIGMSSNYYALFPTIEEMENPVPVYIENYGELSGRTFIDLAECEDLGRTNGDQGHTDHYKSPDGREFIEYISYWQGSAPRWRFV